MNPFCRRSKLSRYSILVLLTLAGPLASGLPAAQAVDPDTHRRMEILADRSPHLYQQHVGYLRHLISAGPDAHDLLTEILDGLTDGQSYLASQNGAFEWAVPIEMNGAAQPITIVYPHEMQPRVAYPLVIRLDDAPTPLAPATRKMPPHITVRIDVRAVRSLLGPSARICLDTAIWARENLPVDPQRVTLDAIGTDVDGVLNLPALAPDIFTAVAMRASIPRDQIPPNLQGLSILLVHPNANLKTIRTDGNLAVRLLRDAGALVEQIETPKNEPRDLSLEHQRATTDWLLAQGRKRAAPIGDLLINDPLFSLFDGRPVHVVVPTGGDDAYKLAAMKMAQAIATCECLEPRPAPVDNPRAAGLGPHARLPVVRDIDIAGKPVRAHWILIGAPSTNLVLAEQITHGPVQVNGDRIKLSALDRSFSADQFGFVYGRTNARDARWRVLVVASDNWRFFTTHAGGPLLPNGDRPYSGQRPDLAVMHAETKSLAGLWRTDPFGQLCPSADARRMPLALYTRIQLDRLTAEAARLATESDAALSATSPSQAARTVLDPESLDLAGLNALIGNEPILVTPLPGTKLAGVIRQAAERPTVTVLPHDPLIDFGQERIYQIAVPMQQYSELTRQLPGLRDELDLRIATQILAAGLKKLFGHPGDLNRDGLVDADDFILFKRCLAGTTGPVGLGCRLADLDGNGTIDSGDFESMRNAWTNTGADSDAGFANQLMTAEDLEDWISNLDH